MRHMPNTLYVTRPQSYLFKEGNTVVVKHDGKRIIQLPVHTVAQIVCFGFEVTVSPPLMAFCAENSISIAWLTESGRFLARVEGPVKGNVLLRRQQYRWADTPQHAVAIARCIVAAKINNSRMCLQRVLRNQPGHAQAEGLSMAIDRLASLLNKTESAAHADALRGLEGEAAGLYFAVFDPLILKQKEGFRFNGRSRRPPLDRVNALLSFLYTLLVFDLRSALETVGLDPCVGYLHTDRPGRPSLALDLMEPFRAPLADRLALNLINRKQLTAADFSVQPTGEVQMQDEARKTLITAYQNRKKEIFTHPFLDEKMEIGLAFQTEARLLARHIRGDLDYFPALVWR